MKNKHLDAKGKGEVIYNYEDDILLFKIKDRDYMKSIDFDNITADIDTEGFITGVRVFDASKILELQKTSLSKINSLEFNAKIEGNIVSVQLKFECGLGKKLMVQRENLVREAIGLDMMNSEVLCSMPA